MVDIDRNIIVVDFDGTLCNTAHRVQFAQNKEWEEFHSRLIDDTPNEDVSSLIEKLPDHFYILGLTGRNEKWRSLTMKWLNFYDIGIDNLIMRPDGDFAPDNCIKPSMLFDFFKFGKSTLSYEEALEEAKEGVLFILEDRDRMVETWRNLGFCCWQVRQGVY